MTERQTIKAWRKSDFASVYALGLYLIQRGLCLKHVEQDEDGVCRWTQGYVAKVCPRCHKPTLTAAGVPVATCGRRGCE